MTEISTFVELVARLSSYKVVALDWDDTLVSSQAQLIDTLVNTHKVSGEFTIEGLDYTLTNVIPTIHDRSLRLLRLLHEAGKEIHIISNKDHDQLVMETAVLGASDMLASVTGSAQKPDFPDMLTRLSKEGIYVGDQAGDTLFALRAGWDFLSLTAKELSLIEEGVRQ